MQILHLEEPGRVRVSAPIFAIAGESNIQQLLQAERELEHRGDGDDPGVEDDEDDENDDNVMMEVDTVQAQLEPIRMFPTELSALVALAVIDLPNSDTQLFDHPPRRASTGRTRRTAAGAAGAAAGGGGGGGGGGLSGSRPGGTVRSGAPGSVDRGAGGQGGRLQEQPRPEARGTARPEKGGRWSLFQGPVRAGADDAAVGGSMLGPAPLTPTTTTTKSPAQPFQSPAIRAPAAAPLGPQAVITKPLDILLDLSRSPPLTVPSSVIFLPCRATDDGDEGGPFLPLRLAVDNEHARALLSDHRPGWGVVVLGERVGSGRTSDVFLADLFNASGIMSRSFRAGGGGLTTGTDMSGSDQITIAPARISSDTSSTTSSDVSSPAIPHIRVCVKICDLSFSPFPRSGDSGSDSSQSQSQRQGWYWQTPTGKRVAIEDMAYRRLAGDGDADADGNTLRGLAPKYYGLWEWHGVTLTVLEEVGRPLGPYEMGLPWVRYVFPIRLLFNQHLLTARRSTLRSMAAKLWSRGVIHNDLSARNIRHHHLWSTPDAPSSYLALIDFEGSLLLDRAMDDDAADVQVMGHCADEETLVGRAGSAVWEIQRKREEMRLAWG